MREILPTLTEWIEGGRRFATATVTQTWGSSPRPIGAVMGVRDDGLVCGSVSGGCVESAVIEASINALVDGKPRELKFDAITEDSVWDVGLSCGGKIQIWVEPDPNLHDAETWNSVAHRVMHDEPAVLATSYEPSCRQVWIPGNPDPFMGAAEGAYRNRQSSEVEVQGKRVFLNVFAGRERLIIVGSVHIAVPLVKFAKELGFETVVIDPRASFANPERYPVAPDRIIAEWPETGLEKAGLTPETYAVVLTHDPKIDDVALGILLNSDVRYIGALGSRVTQAKRRETLLGLGIGEGKMARIHGPVGLNIGARSPEEIAVSIIAEIVQVRRSR